MMNDTKDFDYSIESTVKNNKLQIEYKGKVFKDNPSIVTKNTSKVNVKETETGFIVELDITKGNDLNFSINNINNEELKNNKPINQVYSNLSEVTDLIVIEKLSIWKKTINCIRKLIARNKNAETQKILQR